MGTSLTLPARSGVIIPNRMEQVLPYVVRDAGRSAEDYGTLIGLRRTNTFDALEALTERGLVRFVPKEKQLAHGGIRYFYEWYPTALGEDVITSRDHPGTVLGDLRAALADGPRTFHELERLGILPTETLRTVLRLMVIQGDLVRRRGARAECFGLVPLDDEWDATELPCAA
jgi:hypothetical protein